MHKLVLATLLVPLAAYSVPVAVSSLSPQEKAEVHKAVVVTQEHLNTIIEDAVSTLMKVDEIRKDAPAINDQDVVSVVESFIDTVEPIAHTFIKVLNELKAIIAQKNLLPEGAKKEYNRIIKSCIAGFDAASMQADPQRAALELVGTIRSRLAQAERALKN